MSARDEVLQRVRAALGPTEAVVPPRARPRSIAREDSRELFCARVAAYGAAIHRVGPTELEDRIGSRCEELGVRQLVLPPAGPWRPTGVELVVDDPPLPAETLDRIDGSLTGCAVAIAETGTLVLDGRGACGRRALTLVPDLHLCVLVADQILDGVPEALAAVQPAAAAGCPITFVSGPSATSDIELERVEGVHGPRSLELFLVDASATEKPRGP
jgi:L-lactate dehydrogenase complex protein LldG